MINDTYESKIKGLLEDDYKFYLVEDPMLAVMFGKDKEELENQYREVYVTDLKELKLTSVNCEYVKEIFNSNGDLVNAQGMLKEGCSFEEIVVRTIEDSSMYDFILIDTKSM